MTRTNVVLSVAVATLLNYAIWSQARNSRLNDMLELSDMRSDLSQEWTDEVTYSLLNKLDDNHEEGLRTQGRLEGIVEYITNPKDYHSVWHEGYQRGLNQSEEMAKMQKGELFPVDKPIPVKPNVIEKPEFDKKIDTGGE